MKSSGNNKNPFSKAMILSSIVIASPLSYFLLRGFPVSLVVYFLLGFGIFSLSVLTLAFFKALTQKY